MQIQMLMSRSMMMSTGDDAAHLEFCVKRRKRKKEGRGRKIPASTKLQSFAHKQWKKWTALAPPVCVS